MTHLLSNVNGVLQDFLRADDLNGPDFPDAQDYTILVSNHVKAGSVIYNVINRETTLTLYLELDPRQDASRMSISGGYAVFLQGPQASARNINPLYMAIHDLRTNLAPPRIALSQSKGPNLERTNQSGRECSDITEIFPNGDHLGVVSLREMDHGQFFVAIGANFTNTNEGYQCMQGTMNVGFMSKAKASRTAKALEAQYLR